MAGRAGAHRRWPTSFAERTGHSCHGVEKPTRPGEVHQRPSHGPSRRPRWHCYSREPGGCSAVQRPAQPVPPNARSVVALTVALKPQCVRDLRARSSCLRVPAAARSSYATVATPEGTRPRAPSSLASSWFGRCARTSPERALASHDPSAHRVNLLDGQGPANPKKLAGYTGLCPSSASRAAGTPGPLAKNGPKYLRWALIEAATHAARHPIMPSTTSHEAAARPPARGQGCPGRDRPQARLRDLAHAHPLETFAPQGPTQPPVA